MISLFHTFIHPSAFDEVNRVLLSGFLSEGEVVKRFEERLQNELGLKNCVTVNSGTSALHLALDLAGIEEGDEVILPAQTFIASGLSILQQKAKPVFADIDYETGNISVASIVSKLSPKTKAIMPVHWGGYPCNMEEIAEIAKKNKLMVIEDAAHALGAEYKNKKIGSLSDFTCFSFQAIKHLSTGDGGAICMMDEKITSLAIAKRWFGVNRASSELSELGERYYRVNQLGYKYHLNNFAAALGLANLNDFEKRLHHRRLIANYYTNELRNVKGVQLFNYTNDRKSAYWLFGMHVDSRLNFIRALKANEITASVVHQRIDRNPVFGKLNEDLIHQARFDESQIHIPIHDGIRTEDAEKIIRVIKAGW